MQQAVWLLVGVMAGCGAVKSDMPDAPVTSGMPDGADASTDIDAQPLMLGLDGQRVEARCLNDTAVDACDAELSPAWSETVGGEPGKKFRVTLRVRGVVEQKTYNGGTRLGYWQVGGIPDTTGYNVYHLRVGSQDYYVNAGQSLIRHCWPIDYTQTILVQAQDEIVFEVMSSDTAIIKNRDEVGQPIVVGGIPPAPDSFNGQFVQLDVERIEPQP
jgi:hypothetical protein